MLSSSSSSGRGGRHAFLLLWWCTFPSLLWWEEGTHEMDKMINECINGRKATADHRNRRDTQTHTVCSIKSSGIFDETLPFLLETRGWCCSPWFYCFCDRVKQKGKKTDDSMLWWFEQKSEVERERDWVSLRGEENYKLKWDKGCMFLRLKRMTGGVWEDEDMHQRISWSTESIPWDTHTLY